MDAGCFYQDLKSAVRIVPIVPPLGAPAVALGPLLRLPLQLPPRLPAGQAADRGGEHDRPEDPERVPAALVERLAAVEKRNQELEKQIKELSDRLDALKKAPEGKADKLQGKE